MEKKLTLFILVFCFFVFLFWVVSQKKTPSLKLAIKKEETNKSLIVQGKFPEWLQGSLIRNSSIPIYQNDIQISHEFDGLAMLHSLAFHEGQVLYTNRFLHSQQHDIVVNQGKAQYKGFASQPSLWQSIRGYFASSKEWVTNASVNVVQYGEHYVALTEVPLPARFDLTTLSTLGPFYFQDSLPKKKCWESAHPHLDPSSGEIINFLIEFGRQSHYVIYRIKKGSSSREVIAKVPVDMPAYMHSFAMTEHYIILTEFPLCVKPIDLLIKNKPFIENFVWMPEKGTRFIIIERSSGQILSEMTTDPFFCFHHANAYESENDPTLFIDLVAFPDLSLMNHLFPQSTPSKDAQLSWQRRLMRYQLSLDKNKISAEVLLEKEVEFPRFNEKLEGKKYRYLYMTLSEDGKDKGSGLCKLDLSTKEFKIWHLPNYSVIEPVFVAAPEGELEDEGIILTIAYDATRKHSFLLALEGQSFNEVARAELPWHIPGSFHGQYFYTDPEALARSNTAILY